MFAPSLLLASALVSSVFAAPRIGVFIGTTATDGPMIIDGGGWLSPIKRNFAQPQITLEQGKSKDGKVLCALKSTQFYDSKADAMNYMVAYHEPLSRSYAVMSGQNYTTPESVPIAMNTGNPEAHHVLPVEASIWTLSDNDILGARFVDAKTGASVDYATCYSHNKLLDRYEIELIPRHLTASEEVTELMYRKRITMKFQDQERL